MTPSNHFSMDDLAGFVDGQLPSETEAAISAHLAAGCPECAGRVSFLRRLRRAVRADRWAAPPRAVHRRAVKAFGSVATPRPRLALPPTIRMLAAAAIIVSVVVGVVWLMTPPATYAATIAEIDGPVEVRLAQRAAWGPAALGQTVPPGSEIRAAAGGRAKLLFPSGGWLQLGEQTHVLLTDLTRRDSRWEFTLSQDSGQTESWVDPTTAHYLLRTPPGDIIANGTRFAVRVEAGGVTIISVSEGRVSVITATGSIRVSEGEIAQFASSAPPVILASASANRVATVEPSGAAADTTTPAEGLTEESLPPPTVIPAPSKPPQPQAQTQERLSTPTASRTAEPTEASLATATPDTTGTSTETHDSHSNDDEH